MAAVAWEAEPSAVEGPLEFEHRPLLHLVAPFLCVLKRHCERTSRATEVQAAAARVLPRFVEVVLLVLGDNVVLIFPLTAAAAATT